MNPQLLQVAFSGLLNGYELFQRLRDEARRNKILTPEEDFEFDRKLQEMLAKEHWKPSDSTS
jgi:hypothetical protein